VQDLVELLAYEDLRDAVLVGWSYGVMPIEGAADRVPERVRHLIFLDSGIPKDGECAHVGRRNGGSRPVRGAGTDPRRGLVRPGTPVRALGPLRRARRPDAG
jgi:pimeloyl-ACP methyl ester carboxylesterase